MYFLTLLAFLFGSGAEQLHEYIVQLTYPTLEACQAAGLDLLEQQRVWLPVPETGELGHYLVIDVMCDGDDAA
ncbi:MAG: hypothetical protein OXC11_02310 [Rhodospirillales bacterium]|nr:hypothetical protein [Rhodospirillales bacterium]